MKKNVLIGLIIFLTIVPGIVLAQIPRPSSCTGVGAGGRTYCTWDDVVNICTKGGATGGGVDTCLAAVVFATLGIPSAIIIGLAAPFVGAGAAAAVGITFTAAFGLFLQFFVLPFLGTWMIVYGLMKEMRIFKRAKRVNTWLAFLIAFSMYPAHIAYPITVFLFQILGAWSVLVFGLIFFVGAWKYGVIRRGEWGSAAAVIEAEGVAMESVKNQLKALYTERADLVEEIPDAKAKRLKQITDRIEKIDSEIAKVRQSMATLEEV